MKKIYIYLSLFIIGLWCLFGNINIKTSANINLDTEEVIYKWDYESENLIFFYFPEEHATYYRNFLTLINLDTGGEDPIFKRINDTLLNSSDVQIAEGYQLQSYFWAFTCKYTSSVNLFEFEIFTCDVSNQGAADVFDFRLVHRESKNLSDLNNIPEAVKFDAESVLWIKTTLDETMGPDTLQAILFDNILSNANAFGRWLQTIKEDYTERGYNSGYRFGYNDGINEQLAQQNWWVDLWNGVDAFLSVELLPNLTFGLLFSVPLVFGVLHLILWIWRSGD